MQFLQGPTLTWMTQGYRKFVWFAVLALAGLGAFAAWKWHPANHGPDSIPIDDPRLTFKTPYLNVRPDVHYVGDETCAGCHTHKKIAQSYHQHSMGRSFAPISRDIEEGFAPPGDQSFDALGLNMTVERRGDKVFHKGVKRDAQGKIVSEFEDEIKYVMGSGTRGRSYLIDRDGYLLQSPISWFSQKPGWDRSPHITKDTQSLYRPINNRCLFCHCNDADAIDGSLNHYREPIFQGHAIGCERCHGPGELHVRQKKGGGEFKVAKGEKTIVNPRDLQPAERDAVCQQCHLQGEVRVERRGTKPFDFRPGMPFDSFYTVFEFPPEVGDRRKAVGQVEQMNASTCYQKSAGAMGCISCHNPHRMPSREEKVETYRSACLKCHADKHVCSETEALRKEKSDSCFACHMQRTDSDVPHTAATDHRILRRPNAPAPIQSAKRLLPSIRLVYFPTGSVQPDDDSLFRDLGVAVMFIVKTKPFQPRVQVDMARTILPSLEEAVKNGEEDWPAWIAKGLAWYAMGEEDEATKDFEKVLAHFPNEEAVLEDIAWLKFAYKHYEQSESYWRRALDVNPYSSDYHYQLAVVLAAKKDWEGVAKECQKAIVLNPLGQSARKQLITAYLRLDESAEAEEELAKLLPFADEGEQQNLRDWFGRQKK